MESKIGVLYQDSIGYYKIKMDGKEITAVQPEYEALYDTMRAFDIDRLWVFPDTDLSKSVIPDDIRDIPEKYHPYTPPKFDYDKQPRGISMYLKGDNDRYIFFPAHMECKIPECGDKGQWVLPSYDYLWYTVFYIEQELGMPLLWSGGKMGEELLRRSHASMKSKINPLPPGLGYQWEQVAKKAMDRLVWRTRIPIYSPYWNKKYVFGVDKNGQYTGAANSAILGNGGFHEVTRYDAKSCGFWHYKVTGARSTAFNGIDLPCPLDVKREWASTCLVEAAHKVGVQFQIDKGIVWDEHGRYLEKFASEMWEHRFNFKYGEKEYPDKIIRKNCELSMKLYINAMVGRFMNDYSHEYSHKDWQLGIVHQAVASMVYTLERLYRVFGITPIIIDLDAMYFLTDDPIAFQERTGLTQYQHQLRGYKPIGTFLLNDEILLDFDNKHTGVSEIVATIKENRIDG